MDKTIVQFGKFKGLPWFKVVQDKKYSLWLLKQKWFQGLQRQYVQNIVKCDLCLGNRLDYPECPECQ